MAVNFLSDLWQSCQHSEQWYLFLERAWVRRTLTVKTVSSAMLGHFMLPSLPGIVCRYGSSCARYVKADLPLLNSTSSANVLVVLAIGIALAVLGALLLIIAVLIIIRQRRQLKSLRRFRQAFPSLPARSLQPITADSG